MSLVHVVGFALLILLPGGWITFGLPLRGLPFWARYLAGVMLAPLVVSAQFYLIRLVGAPFELTAILCMAVNLPVIYLIYKQRGRLPSPDRGTILAAGIVLAIILASIAPFLINPQERLYTWEAWTQADVVYSLANGNLDLEDAELAGVRLSYPWAGHVYQAVLSYWAGTPPVTNYIWPNLVWVLCIFGFAAGIVSELGGNPLSQVTVAIWLSFGVNFVGYVLGQIVPDAWVRAHPILGGIWGDNRFTPWLDKILFFGQMYFAMGLFIAILYLIIRQWPASSKRDYLVTSGLMLCGLGLIYPILLPPACAVIGARALTIFLDRPKGWSLGLFKEILGLGVILIIALVVTFAYTKFLTEGRTGAALLQLHDLRFMRQRVIESVIVVSPLLAGFGVLFLRFWQQKRNALIIISLGALASCALYILFDIPWYRNEYKFIFAAAICLAPFPGIAMEPLLTRLGRMAIPLLAVLTIILAFPLASHVYYNAYTVYTKTGPLVDVSHFDLRLDDQEPLSGLVDAIRLETPLDSLLLLDDATLHFPTVTRRQLYVAPSQTEPLPGVLITSDEMLTLVKGYPPQVVADRRSIIRKLFDSDDIPQMEQALAQILKFNRPLVFILNDQRQAALVKWLDAAGIGKCLYKWDGFTLWLIEPTESILTQD